MDEEEIKDQLLEIISRKPTKANKNAIVKLVKDNEELVGQMLSVSIYNKSDEDYEFWKSVRKFATHEDVKGKGKEEEKAEKVEEEQKREKLRRRLSQERRTKKEQERIEFEAEEEQKRKHAEKLKRRLSQDRRDKIEQERIESEKRAKAEKIDVDNIFFKIIGKFAVFYGSGVKNLPQNIKNELKSMGGSIKPELKISGNPNYGIAFPLAKEKEVRKFLNYYD